MMEPSLSPPQKQYGLQALLLLISICRTPSLGLMVSIVRTLSAIYLAHNPVKHQRTKHIEVDFHFAREKVALGQVKVIHVFSSL